MIKVYIEDYDNYIEKRYDELSTMRHSNHKKNCICIALVPFMLIMFFTSILGVFMNSSIMIYSGLIVFFLCFLVLIFMSVSMINDVGYKNFKDFTKDRLIYYCDYCYDKYMSDDESSILDYLFGKIVFGKRLVLENDGKLDSLFLIDNSTAVTEYKGKCRRLKLDAIVYCSQRESNLVLLNSGNFKLLVGKDKKGFTDLRC